MLSLRLSRHGAKKRPFYFIVVADGRAPRDGRFIERLGSYNPMLPKDHAERVKLDVESAKAWIAKGAQPTDRMARILAAAGVTGKYTPTATPKKSAPRAKTQERMKIEAEAAAKVEADKAAAAAAPAPAAE